MRQPLLRFCSGTGKFSTLKFSAVKFSCGFLALSAAALALSMAATPARAMDDGDDTLLNELVSVISPDKVPDIDYQDRAPLVLPPKGKGALPSPKQANAKPNAAWPNDPDVSRRRQAAEDAKLPIEVIAQKHSLYNPDDKNARLAARAAPVSSNAPSVNDCRQKHCPMTPEQVAATSKAMEGLGEQKYAPGEEPDRQWLTEPPKGYRKVTRNVADYKEAEAAPTKNPLKFWQWFSN